jgi:membrane-bound ClpP family serine protease
MTDAGVALLVIGAIVAVAEAHAPTHGIMGGLGVLVMAIGAVLAISGLGGGFAIGLAGGVVLAGAGAGALALTVRPGLEAGRRRVRTGAEGMPGRIGVVSSWSGPEGRVALDGGTWIARRCLSPEEPTDELHAGDRVVVVSLTGLTLSVRPAEEWELI